MKCRLHDNHKAIGSTGKFETSALSEVFAVIGEEYGTWFIKDLDVFIKVKGEWMHLPEAFKNKDVITDNFNTIFFEPLTVVDKNRGYTK